MNLEIVSHCWNYSRLLTYQLSSLVLFPPAPVQVTMTVFHAKSDAKTLRVLNYFANRHVPGVAWQFCALPEPDLLRRAIGRNMAAERTEADWVWYADCDMVFGADCLSALPGLLEQVDGPLAYPRHVQVNVSQETGDQAIQAVKGPGCYSINPDDFAPRRYDRAIGGVQIVRGNVLRETGYCRGSRWMRRANRWRRTYEDRSFRRSLGTRGEPIDLPECYRIRHSKRGRFDVGVEL